MPSRVMLALGDYRFSIDTAAYQGLRRSTEYRWSSQDRIRNAPARQYGGPGPDSIELEGLILPEYRGGLKQLDLMRAEASKGVPLLLVDGLGKVHGYWVIDAIEESQSTFFSDGVPRRQEFRLRMSRYNDPVKASK